MTDYTLQDALDNQRQLQTHTYGDGVDPKDYDPRRKMQFLGVNVLALEDELHEALAETGWKPWAKSNHLNRDAFKGELVDALHFFLNLMITADISAEELLQGYQDKSVINKKRQEDGYDGVTTKCPNCKRALDDPAVLCKVISSVPHGYTKYWCDEAALVLSFPTLTERTA